MEVFHGLIWLPAIDSTGGRADILSAWRSFSIYRHTWSHPSIRPSSRSPTWGEMHTVICNVEGYESEDSWVLQLFSVPEVLCLIYKFPCFRVQCVTYYGQILMIEEVGVFHPVVLVTPLVRIFQRPLTIQMGWHLCHEHINLLWRVIIGEWCGSWHS